MAIEAKEIPKARNGGGRRSRSKSKKAKPSVRDRARAVLGLREIEEMYLAAEGIIREQVCGGKEYAAMQSAEQSVAERAANLYLLFALTRVEPTNFEAVVSMMLLDIGMANGSIPEWPD